MTVLLAKKYRKFEEDTALMLGVLWDTENYSSTDANKINDHFVTEYFRDKIKRKNLEVVDGKCHNINGADVRQVAKNYIEHYKMTFNIKKAT